MFKQLSFTILLLCFTTLCLHAQNSVNGIIKNTNGEPLEGANIVVLSGGDSDVFLGTTSDENGYYNLAVGNAKTVMVQYSYVGFQTIRETFSFYRNKRVTKNLEMLEDNTLGDIDVTARRDVKTGGVTRIDPKLADKIPLGSIEKLVVLQGMGATSNNELSSQYTVRGGNFDENLVYVNDFEIYRPFLIRSGQQEGLSFINPNMVSSVEFSTGGFEAKYGDKLSSVLDVKYKKPREFGGSAGISLLGTSAHLEGTSKNKSFTYLMGFRHKTNQYFLNALPTEGQYKPLFLDFQSFLTYQINSNIELQYISNFSSNRYEFLPQFSESTFGDVTQAYRLSIYFEGGEKDRYRSFMNGLGLNYLSDDQKLSLKLQAANYSTTESEAYDIIGQYFIGQVESNLGEENFGDVVQSYGVGTYHDWVRNRLKANFQNVVHKGFLDKGKHFISWGTRYQHEFIDDKIDEWQRVDSAGYSIPININQVPYEENEVTLFRILKTKNTLNSHRASAFIQDSWTFGNKEQVNITGGVRANYWSVNDELIVTPRFQFYWKPVRNFRGDSTNVEKVDKWKFRQDSTGLNLRLATGMYHQPPFYRELRNQQGQVNLDLKAQKSFHAVAGLDYQFYLWKRPFKFSTELYYKYLWDLVPYDVENVLIRYYGDNIAKGFAYGIDFRLNGEFVPGVESWFSLSILNTQEDLIGDQYTIYLDSLGNELPGSPNYAQLITDTSTVSPGFIRRPTDQRVTCSIYFQDYIPGNENFKMNLNVIFGTPLPFSPPNNTRFRNSLQSPIYGRVDIGFSAQLFKEGRKELREGSFLRHFKDIWASVEVFNLLGIPNVVSYNWVSDYAGTTYAVPNRLTARRLNVKLVVKF